MLSIDEAMAAFQPALPLAVGFSGGADSTVLLHACAARWPNQMAAVHVHHGLQAAADGFVVYCQRVCNALGIPLIVRHIDARHHAGDSPEDAARRARYACFDTVANERIGGTPVRTIALAQHADDQVETLLLALSRGGGVAGLAAMPASWTRGTLAYARPLLSVPAPALRQWLAANRISWIEDPTNHVSRFTRNRIRQQVLPALEAALPQFRTTFARSARHAAEASALCMEFAVADLVATGDPPAIDALQGLSTARQANVLRHWLRKVHATTPSAAQLSELLAQVSDCRTRGHHIALSVGRGQIVRDGTVLRFAAALQKPGNL